MFYSFASRSAMASSSASCDLLKEQCLYLHRFQSLAEERRIISASIARYNTEWLIERLGHQTPVAERAAAKAA